VQVILYSFYKNVTLVFTLFIFGFFNGSSGTTLFESWLGAGWNVGWTFLPILAVGIFDRDMSSATTMKYPIVYAQGQNNAGFSPKLLTRVRGNRVLVL
jgi:magnesium-transporting ATPase (P-type)